MTQEEPVKVLVAVGEGSEEIETISVVDVLRRAGAEVTLASVSRDRQVKCSRGVELVADKIMEEIKEDTEYDCIVCPGGMPGSTNLAASKELQGLLQKHCANGRAVLAAICAAPAVIFEPLGFLKAHKATCHPAFADRILSAEGGCSEERVVVSNNNRLVTSRGPGTSIEFALKLVELLFDSETAKKVCTPMMTHL